MKAARVRTSAACPRHRSCAHSWALGQHLCHPIGQQTQVVAGASQSKPSAHSPLSVPARADGQQRGGIRAPGPCPVTQSLTCKRARRTEAALNLRQRGQRVVRAVGVDVARKRLVEVQQPGRIVVVGALVFAAHKGCREDCLSALSAPQALVSCAVAACLAHQPMLNGGQTATQGHITIDSLPNTSLQRQMHAAGCRHTRYSPISRLPFEALRRDAKSTGYACTQSRSNLH